MTEKINEFKFGTLRNFGSEQFTFNAVIYSDKTKLSDEEIDTGIKQIHTAIDKAFQACLEREISEMKYVAAAADRRAAEVKKRDEALKAEMVTKEEAVKTLKTAEAKSDKLTKK